MKYNKKNNKWIGLIIFITIAIIMYYKSNLILQHGLQLLSFSAIALIVYFFFSDVIFQKHKKMKKIPKNRKVITDKELDELAAWLQSDEGRKKIRESLDKADAVCKIIESMNDIDPKTWREPFNI